MDINRGKGAERQHVDYCYDYTSIKKCNKDCTLHYTMFRCHLEVPGGCQTYT